MKITQVNVGSQGRWKSKYECGDHVMLYMKKILNKSRREGRVLEIDIDDLLKDITYFRNECKDRGDKETTKFYKKIIKQIKISKYKGALTSSLLYNLHPHHGTLNISVAEDHNLIGFYITKDGKPMPMLFEF